MVSTPKSKSDAELVIPQETQLKALAELSEDDLLDLHKRVRRARNITREVPPAGDRASSTNPAPEARRTSAISAPGIALRVRGGPGPRQLRSRHRGSAKPAS